MKTLQSRPELIPYYIMQFEKQHKENASLVSSDSILSENDLHLKATAFNS